MLVDVITTNWQHHPRASDSLHQQTDVTWNGHHSSDKTQRHNVLCCGHVTLHATHAG